MQEIGNHSIKNICTAQYNFDQLVVTLDENIQLEREIKKAGKSSKICYGQLTIRPRHVRKYDYDHRHGRNIGNNMLHRYSDSEHFKKRLNCERLLLDKSSRSVLFTGPK